MFEIPGSNICSVEIDEDVVMGQQNPKYVRSSGAPCDPSQDSYDNGAETNASRAVNN